MKSSFCSSQERSWFIGWAEEGTGASEAWAPIKAGGQRDSLDGRAVPTATARALDHTADGHAISR
jgi:hypothetical protein